ncbi:hypothetical protein ACMD2_11183 [Ananas comosus]|uniref:Uncharacterized protein n=1 Tax=Ananas comosus TaxID=4615 RepID=A0A199USP8_ANACO|nr:hypothetical protein ACMD2_11183 [Ananas comosus]
MASQEAAAGTSNKLKVGRTTEYRMGANTELLNITAGGGGGCDGEGTKLFLLCGADRFESVRPFRSGEFSVHMVRVKGRPISLVTCMVDDHRWMLAKDAMAGRVEARISSSRRTWRNPAVAAIAAAAAAKSSTAEPELVQQAVRSSAAVKILARSSSRRPQARQTPPPPPRRWPAAALRHVGCAALLTAIETGQIPSAAMAAVSGAEPDVGGGGSVGWWYVNGDGMALLLRVMRFARADSAVRAVAWRWQLRRGEEEAAQHEMRVKVAAV